MNRDQFFERLKGSLNPATAYEGAVDDMTNWFERVFHGNENTYHQSQDPNWESYRSAPVETAETEETTTEEATDENKTESNGSTNPFGDDVSEGEYVTFTYEPGDTFGQKILDLGLGTENGLWGTDGDVNFYTRQLIDQDALDANGNVKLGQTFKLRRRK